MATAVDLADAKYPANVKPMEGRSLAPLFLGGSIEREALYWEHEGNRAVRVGDWKLVAEHGKPWELYNLARDRSELNDLSKEQASRVEEMSALWQKYASRANVEPWEKVIPKKTDKPAKQKSGQ
jgi:arylsulfatase A-like enzyme